MSKDSKTVGFVFIVINDTHYCYKKEFATMRYFSAWKNSKLLAQVEDRQRSDAMRFKEAGQGPLVKTYPYDPTKVKKTAAPSKK